MVVQRRALVRSSGPVPPLLRPSCHVHFRMVDSRGTAQFRARDRLAAHMLRCSLRPSAPNSHLHSRLQQNSPPSCLASHASAAPVTQARPPADGEATGLGFRGVHHVAVCCASLEASLDFYCGVLGACSAQPCAYVAPDCACLAAASSLRDKSANWRARRAPLTSLCLSQQACR